MRNGVSTFDCRSRVSIQAMGSTFPTERLTHCGCGHPDHRSHITTAEDASDIENLGTTISLRRKVIFGGFP
jgi:hypothetical protein